MIIPDYALFRVGQSIKVEEYERIVGEKLELWAGVLTDLSSPLCWPPPAVFTRGRRLSEADYQALTVPQAGKRSCITAWCWPGRRPRPAIWTWKATATRRSAGSSSMRLLKRPVWAIPEAGLA